MTFDSRLTSIKGIGPRRAELFGKLGLFSLGDIIRFVPRDYLDFSSASMLNDLEHGQLAAVKVKIEGIAKTAFIPGGLRITTARGVNEEGKILLCWYNQPFRARSIEADMECFACGRVDKLKGLRLVSPSLHEKLPGIVPVYPTTKGLSQAAIRSAALAALDTAKGSIDDNLPDFIKKRYELIGLAEAFVCAHSPTSFEALKAAKRRLAFDDMFYLSLMLSILRKERMGEKRLGYTTEGALEEFLSMLPFKPTTAQLKAMREIEADMRGDCRMNRLVQGDVGSGKTAVALFAMFVAARSNKQSVIMAPTEILALQHYESLKELFGERAVFLTGGLKQRERFLAINAILTGEALYVVGTHALLYDNVTFNDLGLVIADEQHRFGVGERARLGGKGGGTDADTMILSATPIPRTLSLMMFGDLDISVIDELPPGRKPVKTQYVPRRRRDDMYAFVDETVKKGSQVYVVCPLVERSEVLEGVISVEELYVELQGKLTSRLALLHGQMASAKKEEITNAFKRGEIDVLVSTTVVEVGIDVKNATIMVIENADRFGLAQLHQLRGRVGRNNKDSWCFLLSDSDSESAIERIKILTETNDGFEIAERDLEMRGAGEFLGTRQHGTDEFSAAYLANAKLKTPMSVLTDARRAAQDIINDAEFDEDANLLLLEAKRMLNEKKASVAMN